MYFKQYIFQTVLIVYNMAAKKKTNKTVFDAQR